MIPAQKEKGGTPCVLSNSPLFLNNLLNNLNMRHMLVTDREAQRLIEEAEMADQLQAEELASEGITEEEYYQAMLVITQEAIEDYV